MAGAASSNSGKSFDRCPICLDSEKKDEAYLDQCFHSFCYKCITQWSSFVTKKHSKSLSVKCPLCKTQNFSIVSGFDGEFFQRDFVNQGSGERYFSSFHKFRLQCYSNTAGTGNSIFDVPRYWKCRKYLQKNIWLQSWLRREIQALVQEDDVDIIVHHIHGAAQSFFASQERGSVKGKPEQKQEEFRTLLSDVARPFILGRTVRFVEEVELFLASGLTIEAYDKVLQALASNNTGLYAPTSLVLEHVIPPSHIDLSSRSTNSNIKDIIPSYSSGRNNWALTFLIFLFLGVVGTIGPLHSFAQ